MNVVRADQRLSRCEFREGRDWETYPPTIYTCPHCQHELALVMRDFARHARSTHTNLSASDAAAIAQTLPFGQPLINSFLDFYCPGCRAPVRLYYVADQLVGSQRGVYGYVIEVVIERRRPLTHVPDGPSTAAQSLDLTDEEQHAANAAQSLDLTDKEQHAATLDRQLLEVAHHLNRHASQTVEQIFPNAVRVNALEYWATLGNLGQVKRALAGGADVNARSATGQTALHAAVAKGHAEVVRVLVEHGAHLHAQTDAGETALTLAQRKQQTAIADYLRESGA